MRSNNQPTASQLYLFVGILAGLVGLFGCSNSSSDKLTDPFPKRFLWGTATAGFQVDMGCPSAPCLDRNSDWYQWVTTDPVIDKGYALGQPLQDGPGHWELYETDFDLARNELHNNSYRMSIEWSRIFPESTEGIQGYDNLKQIADPDAVAHYHDVFAALKARDMVPLVTLNHYSLPLWIHDGAACFVTFETTGNVDGCDNPGWLDGDRIIGEIAKYAGFVAREYGGEVDLWATMNEPYAVILSGFAVPTPSERTNPPGLSSLEFEFAAPVIRNMIVAHARMYDAVVAADVQDADGDDETAEIGIVMNLADAEPSRANNELDRQGVENFNYLYNWLFLDAFTKGNWDADLDGVVDSVRSDLANRLDYIGINYYTSLKLIGFDGEVVTYAPVVNFIPESTLLFNFEPQGMYTTAIAATERYDLPIYITENGAATSFDPTGADALVPHLAWLRKAIADGADVRGYYYWSLVDNYEWNHGYDLKFGLYGYDPQTKARTARPVVKTYGTIAAENRLREQHLLDHGGDALPEPP